MLLRSSEPVGGSPEALSQLQTARVPFIFLTNGGGKSEEARVQDLRDKLRIKSLRTDSIVQSHTPFRDLKHLHDKNVLVIGGDGDKCRAVAHRYIIMKRKIKSVVLIIYKLRLQTCHSSRRYLGQ